MNCGFHQSKDSISNKYGNTIQIFSQNPKEFYKNKTIEKIKELDDFKYVFTHAQYIISLTKLTKEGKLNSTYINSILYELRFLHQYKGGIGAVIHAGSADIEDDKCYKTIIAYLNTINKYIDKDNKCQCIIENMATCGNKVIDTVDKMITFNTYIIKFKLSERVSFCFDTCHDHVSTYIKYNSIPTDHTIDKHLQKLIDNKVHVSIVHLNNTKSHTKDEHEDLELGLIPVNEILLVIEICKKNEIPMIVERINSTKEEKEKMLTLINIY